MGRIMKKRSPYTAAAAEAVITGRVMYLRNWGEKPLFPTKVLPA
jgi:hypothetical protein